MGSFLGVMALLVYLAVLLILVININRKNKIIKHGFIIVLLLLLLMLTVSNNSIVDNILKMLVYYWYYPSFSLYLTLLFLALFFFIYNIFNDELGVKFRIINFTFASLIIISYIVFMLLNINTYSYTELYSDNSLTCLRYMTRTSFIWICFLITYYLYRKYSEDDEDE